MRGVLRVEGSTYLFFITGLASTQQQATEAAATVVDRWVRRELIGLSERLYQIAIETAQNAFAFTSRAPGREQASRLSELLARSFGESVAVVCSSVPAVAEQAVRVAVFPGTLSAWVTPHEMLAIASANDTLAAAILNDAGGCYQRQQSAELYQARAGEFRLMASAAVQP